MSWLLVLASLALVLVAASFLSWAWSILKNYAAARTIGVPIRVIPFSPWNPFWALVERRVVSFLRRLRLDALLGNWPDAQDNNFYGIDVS